MLKRFIKQTGSRQRAEDTRGMALMLCLLMIASLCLIGGAALGVAGLNRKIVHNGAKGLQAFYAAEAGRQLALAHLRRDPLWRGDGAASGPGFRGNLLTLGRPGSFSVTLSDRTRDHRGVYDALLPPGCVLVTSAGTFLEAGRRVSCLVRIRPLPATAAAFPEAALVSAGTLTGPLTALNGMGDEDSLLIRTVTALPRANQAGLEAQAETVLPALDNDAWDATLGGIHAFWRDAPADTRPHIVYIQGDIDLSGDRRLFGIVFAAGREIVLGGRIRIDGILYAPDARRITIENSGAPGRVVLRGLLIAGPGGVEVTGNRAAVQWNAEYVSAFNEAAAAETTAEVVPGSWRSL